MIRPSNLQKGDTIALVSPAKSIEEKHISFAKTYFEAKGYKVIIGDHAAGEYHYFAGTDEERTADFQWAIDHPEVKAIVCNRGGYGAIRVLNRVQWANLLREPKWIVGFSDITNFHLQGLKLGVETIHASMPLNFETNSIEALETLMTVLTTGSVSHQWPVSPKNIVGQSEGIVVGGNLSILYSLLGTPLCPSFENAILFVEDIGEQVYNIDRMIQALSLAGAFEQIKGLVVGGMTDLKETAVPTNWDYRDLFLEPLRFRQIPVAFDVPIGHIDDNRAVICGRKATFEVNENEVIFYQK